jgi:Methyltransferase domain
MERRDLDGHRRVVRDVVGQPNRDRRFLRPAAGGSIHWHVRTLSQPGCDWRTKRRWKGSAGWSCGATFTPVAAISDGDLGRRWAALRSAAVVRLADRRDTFLRRRFALLERMGIHAVPRYWMEPIPDRGTLSDQVFMRRASLTGIDMRPDGQLAILDEVRQYADEYGAFAVEPTGGQGPDRFFLTNGAFEAVDAELLHGMVRRAKPRLVIEIGVGFSSLVTAGALALNERDGAPAARHVGIDPVPGAAARTLDRYELHQIAVQDVDPSVFAELQSGDILFIDSSHVLATGSDVAFEYNDLLPNLAPGVIVHIHDIFLPLEYPAHWLREQLWFPNEQYLLQAFLAFNHEFEILCAASYLAHTYPDRVKEAFATFDPDRIRPGSFWMQRVRH